MCRGGLTVRVEWIVAGPRSELLRSPKTCIRVTDQAFQHVREEPTLARLASRQSGELMTAVRRTASIGSLSSHRPQKIYRSARRHTFGRLGDLRRSGNASGVCIPRDAIVTIGVLRAKGVQLSRATMAPGKSLRRSPRPYL